MNELSGRRYLVFVTQSNDVASWFSGWVSLRRSKRRPGPFPELGYFSVYLLKTICGLLREHSPIVFWFLKFWGVRRDC